MKTLTLMISLFFALSCTEDVFTPEDLYKLIRKGDPTVQAVMAKMGQPLVYCADYNPPCENAFVVKVKGMDVIFLHYANHESAYKAAVNMQGFVTRNWAIDDVKGEPVLESFMMKYLGARRAR